MEEVTGAQAGGNAEQEECEIRMETSGDQNTFGELLNAIEQNEELRFDMEGYTSMDDEEDSGLAVIPGQQET